MRLALSTRVQMSSFTTTFPDSTYGHDQNRLEEFSIIKLCKESETTLCSTEISD